MPDEKLKESFKGVGGLGDLPLMTDEEINKVTYYLKKDFDMFEWGSGGSTLYFSKFVKKYISVEHDDEWYKVVGDIIKKQNIKNVEYYNIKPNTKLYYFLDLTSYKNKFEEDWNITINKKTIVPIFYKSYINFITKLNIDRFDTILIDGRARLYCAISALPYMDKDSIMFIHDFFMNPEYHYILKYMDIIDFIGRDEYYRRIGLNVPTERYGRRGTLVILKKKDNVDYDNDLKFIRD
jgi:hypothetical protein